MTESIRVLVADDHTIVRMGITALLDTEPGIAVVGEAEDGHAAVRLSARLKPDVILMDLMMPVMDGVAATREIRAILPDVKVLVLTTSTSSDEISRAIAAGACGAM